MGFEPAEHFCSTAFKAVALTQTLPTLHGRREWNQTISVYTCHILFYSAMLSVMRTTRDSSHANGKHLIPPKALCVKCDGMNSGEDLTGFEPVNKQFLAARSPTELKVHVTAPCEAVKYK